MPRSTVSGSSQWFLCQVRIDSCGPCFIKQQPKWGFHPAHGIFRFWLREKWAKVLVKYHLKYQDVSKYINLWYLWSLVQYAKAVPNRRVDAYRLTAALWANSEAVYRFEFAPQAQAKINGTVGHLNTPRYSHHESALHSSPGRSRSVPCHGWFSVDLHPSQPEDSTVPVQHRIMLTTWKTHVESNPSTGTWKCSNQLLLPNFSR